MPSTPPKLALVLAGGAARGAYEIGALQYIIERWQIKMGRLPRWQIMLGTSIGALHTVRLAAEAHTPDGGVGKLFTLWQNIKPESVYTITPCTVLGWLNAIRGGKDCSSGLLDTTPKDKMTEKDGNWEGLHKNIASGTIEVVGLASVSANTGRVTFYCETGKSTLTDTFQAVNQANLEAGYEFVSTYLAPLHAAASSAMPVIFPAVKMNGQFWVDGGVRLNEPYQAAADLGATHVLGISTLTQDRRGALQSSAGTKSPSLLASIQLMIAAYFDTQRDFAAAQADMASKTLLLSPSRNLGLLAGEYLTGADRSGESLRSRVIYAMLSRGVGPDADIAAYMLFEPAFAVSLMLLGRADADANWHAIEAFLLDADA